MRLVAAGCALALVALLAAFGAVLSHQLTGADPASTARTPAESAAPPSEAAAIASGRTRQATLPDAAPAPASTGPAAQAPNQAPNQVPNQVSNPLTQVFAQAPAPASKGAAPAGAAAPTAAAAPGAGAPAALAGASCLDNPNALGISRVVEIDTTGGPGFGFEHFKTHDFLRPGEVVLTFDDGPWPRHTPAVLAALAAHCTKAIFFPIGKHSMWEPGILKQVVAAGHAVGSHTWSHADLSKKSVQEAKDEIEKGISAVHWAAGAPTA